MSVNRKSVLCDTGIISDSIAEDGRVRFVVNEIIKPENVFINSVVLIELNRWLSLYKNLEKENRKAFLEYINNLEIIRINEKASKKAEEISKKDNSLDAADILIGATAIVNNVPIYTNNIKHFERMVNFGLKLFKT